VVLGTGLVILGIAYRGFGKWMSSKKFSYTRPHVSRFARTAMLAFFGIGLVTGVNLYVQIEVMLGVGSDFSDEAIQTFEKIINTINILVIGYTISHLIPIGLNKSEKTKLEAEDFENFDIIYQVQNNHSICIKFNSITNTSCDNLTIRCI